MTGSKTYEVPKEGKRGTQATLRQAADIPLLSTARGPLATKSMQTASALHLRLLSQWHGDPALLPPPFTSSWLPWPSLDTGPLSPPLLVIKLDFPLHFLTLVSSLLTLEDSPGLENPGSAHA